MTFREKIENDPFLWLSGFVIGAFITGLTTYPAILRVAAQRTISQAEYDLFTAQRDELIALKGAQPSAPRPAPGPATVRPATPAPAAVRPEPSPVRTPEAGGERLDVTSVVPANDNAFGGYGADQVIDGNVLTFWSSKAGATLDVALTLHLARQSAVTAVHLLAPFVVNDNHAQPSRVELTFLDSDGRPLGKREMRLAHAGSRSAQWDQASITPVIDHVDAIRLSIDEPTKPSTKYLTLSEVRVYGR